VIGTTTGSQRRRDKDKKITKGRGKNSGPLGPVPHWGEGQSRGTNHKGRRFGTGYVKGALDIRDLSSVRHCGGKREFRFSDY